MAGSKLIRYAAAVWIASSGLAGSSSVRADTLPWALAQAYVNNPVVNAQRASLRATSMWLAEP